ncbi:MAG: hypothetical protein EZS28_020260 [Streblomastix strix]|uniref:Myb-like domain-containing protein n=1 Tax=Streblomastix strix TaxID=222440 RepID=A0A5J4VNR2_9EUKA|nr:MAG: hypothetical protein EZS28_020260 [Streblomastix strix]
MTQTGSGRVGYATSFCFIPKISHAPWTKDENEIFLSIIDRIGVRYFEDIARNIEINIDNQYQMRLNISQKDGLEWYYQRILKMKIVESLITAQGAEVTMPLSIPGNIGGNNDLKGHEDVEGMCLQPGNEHISLLLNMDFHV